MLGDIKQEDNASGLILDPALKVVLETFPKVAQHQGHVNMQTLIPDSANITPHVRGLAQSLAFSQQVKVVDWVGPCPGTTKT